MQLRTCQALGETRSLKHKLQPAGAKMVSGSGFLWFTSCDISILNAIWCFTVKRAFLVFEGRLGMGVASCNFVLL